MGKLGLFSGEVLKFSGWWFQISFIFTPNLGEMIQFDEYFSDGMKPPTSFGVTLVGRSLPEE